METQSDSPMKVRFPTWAILPTPAKTLGTAVIFSLALAMVGALGQIIVHDIIPKFYSDSDEVGHHAGSKMEMPGASQMERHGDEMEQQMEGRGGLLNG